MNWIDQSKFYAQNSQEVWSNIRTKNYSVTKSAKEIKTGVKILTDLLKNADLTLTELTSFFKDYYYCKT